MSRGSDEGAADASSEGGEAVVPMVVSRPRRSNAGNRMSSLLALAEAGQDEKEFYEGEGWEEKADDAEFGGVDAEAPDDISLESSDDADEDEGDDDEEAGEKELKRQERKDRSGKRKEKNAPFLQAALRRKIKLDAKKSQQSSKSDTQKARKKSERVSWLPEGEVGPRRTSSRKLALQNKEQIHKRLKEGESRRLRILAVMQAAARRKEEARNRRAMTQEDRLVEAARVEKENSKSLHRWEEAEKKREADQQAKLEALKNRQLEGPFVRYYSGPAVWLNNKLIGTGKSIKVEEVEENVINEPDNSVTKIESSEPTPSVENNNVQVQEQVAEPAVASNISDTPQPSQPQPIESVEKVPQESVQITDTTENQTLEHRLDDPAEKSTPKSQPSEPAEKPAPESQPNEPAEKPALESQSINPAEKPAPGPQINDSTERPMPGAQPSDPPRDDHSQPQSSQLPTETMSETPQEKPDSQQQLTYPHSIMFAPPPGPDNFLRGIYDFASLPDVVPPQAPPAEPSAQATLQQPENAAPLPEQASVPTEPLRKPSPPPRVIEKAMRNLVILESFDEIKPRDKEAIARALFSWSGKVSLTSPAHHIGIRASKHAHLRRATPCAITAQPARYRDPLTHLPYHDRYAYKCIRRVLARRARWSSLLGCYSGPVYERGVAEPARGVPRGFWGPVPASGSRSGQTGGEQRSKGGA